MLKWPVTEMKLEVLKQQREVKNTSKYKYFKMIQLLKWKYTNKINILNSHKFYNSIFITLKQMYLSLNDSLKDNPIH